MEIKETMEIMGIKVIMEIADKVTVDKVTMEKHLLIVNLNLY